MLEWLLLITQSTLIRSPNLFSGNHSTLCFWSRREGWQMLDSEVTLTNWKKQPPEIFYKNNVLKNFATLRTYADCCFWSDFMKWLFGTLFLDCIWRHLDSVTLQKYQLLSNQSFKRNLAYLPSIYLTPMLFMSLGFVCSWLMVTTQKANACSPWTAC